MKGVDTNVLIRYITQDDPAQSSQAARIIEGAARRQEPLFVSLLVLSETAWVLDRRYDQGRSQIAAALERILAAAAFHIESIALARACLGQYRTGKGGFADYVLGAIALDAGCDETYTFDRDLRGAAGFHVL